jgi:hypothetical protein
LVAPITIVEDCTLFIYKTKNFLLTKPSPTLPLPLHPRTQGALANADRGAPFVPAQPPLSLGEKQSPLYRHNPYCSLFQGLCFNFVFFSRSNHAIAILIMLQFSFLSFSVMGLHALIFFSFDGCFRSTKSECFKSSLTHIWA